MNEIKLPTRIIKDICESICSNLPKRTTNLSYIFEEEPGYPRYFKIVQSNGDEYEAVIGAVAIGEDVKSVELKCFCKEHDGLIKRIGERLEDDCGVEVELRLY